MVGRMRWWSIIAVLAMASWAKLAYASDAEIVARLHEKAPGILAPLIDYDSDVGEPPSCSADIAPAVRAVLVGASEPGPPFGMLTGPQHDVDLLRSSFLARKVPEANIAALTGAEATREKLAETFVNVVKATNCGDRVWLHFGGNSAYAADLFAELLDEDPPTGLFDTEELWLALNAKVVGRTELVSATDISEFVTNLRNRMASVVISLDTSYAASARIAELQSASEVRPIWRREVPGDAAPSRDEALGAHRTRLLPSHGDFAVFYSSVEDSHALELAFANPDGSRTVHGMFSFRLATAIQNAEIVSVRRIADGLTIPAEETEAGLRFRIEASNPELSVLGETSSLPRLDPIVITSPPQMRGAAMIQSPMVDIEGAVNWSAPVRAVLVNGTVADLKPGQRFTARRELQRGLNAIEIIALTGDGRTHSKTLELRFAGDVEALAVAGIRYAVIIANEGYDLTRTGFGPLATPFRDADVVAEILERKFGFQTSVVSRGQEFSLVLKDATRRDIETILYKIGTVAGENDTVLIYYAGHGIYEERTTIAFWVPVDAETGVPISYVSASAISEAVQRMQARKVVVISDSCFSGALLRGGARLSPEEAEANRETALMRLAGKRTRLLISSGGNEPVEDGGGDGHSVFARALLTGLREMDHVTFSARELFDGYVYPLVTSRARQEPQFRPLEQTGHDGGDLVFVRLGREHGE